MTNNMKNLESRVKCLEEEVFGKKSAPSPKQDLAANFNNIRAFLNSTYKQLKSGHERLLAIAIFKSGGRPDKVYSKELVGLWNRGKKFLGNFDPQYFTRATEKGWLTPLGKGVYKLETTGINYFTDILKRK